MYKVPDVDSTRFEALPGESDMNRTCIVPHQNTVFCQLANRLPLGVLDRLIEQPRADKGVRTLDTKQMLLTLLLAQLSDARGLRDIEALLESQGARRYHSGLPAVRKSTLANAAAKRPAEVFTGVLGALIGQLTAKLPRGIGDCVRLVDSTTVPLNTLSAKWSRFSDKLCGAKAHVVYDPDANCPLYFGFTPARINDITAARPGAAMSDRLAAVRSWPPSTGARRLAARTSLWLPLPHPGRLHRPSWQALVPWDLSGDLRP